MAGVQGDQHCHPRLCTSETTASVNRYEDRTCADNAVIRCPFCAADFSIDVHRDTLVPAKIHGYPVGVDTAGAGMNLSPDIVWWVPVWWITYALTLGVLIYMGSIWC